MKCFCHDDPDGRVSGAIIKQRYPECDVIEVNYLSCIDDYSVQRGEKIFVVDMCFPIKQMEFLCNHCDFVWIDHHETSIEDLKHLNIRGIRETKDLAACELTWKYIYPDKAPPRIVEHIGRYDMWCHEHPYTLPIHYGMNIYDQDPNNIEFWKIVFSDDNDFFMSVVDDGHVIMKYVIRQNELYAKAKYFEQMFYGYRALIINAPYHGSELLDSVYDPKKHDITILFGMKEGKYKYSLRSSKPEINVGTLAKGFGGGGRQGAASFYTQTCIFY